MKEKAAHVWARDPNDWYLEGPETVAFLLARETFHGPVYDPACGSGNIVRTCMDHGLEAFGTDLIRRTYGWPEWFVGVRDFLAGDVPVEAVDVICNPPYYGSKGAEAFIRRALAIHRVGKVAMLVNAKFLFGDRRCSGLFRDKPPSRVLPIFPRPSIPTGEWLAAGNKASGGSEDFCWLVWEPRVTGTQIVWHPELDVL